MHNEQRDNPGVIAPPPLIFALPLVFGLLLHWFRPVKLLSPALCGLCVLFAGIIVPSALREMRRAGTNVDPNKPAETIVTSGPFQYTRNPFYLSLTLLYAGITTHGSESPTLSRLILTHILRVDSVKRPLWPLQSLTVSPSHQ